MTEVLLAKLRAQDTARATLERALETGRVHHAYLFAGPNGVGKELAAFGFAQALVCEKREAPLHRACGQCSACARSIPRTEERTALHPDIIVIERALYAPQAIGRRTPETQDISIDQVRTLVLSRAAYAPHEGRAKVIIVRRAEELSISAANALLKTLEEPNKATHFILLTAHPDALLPTILSRTLRVRFSPLPDHVVAQILEERGVAKDRAPEVARLAAGSVEAGELLADPDESSARDEFVRRALEAVDAPSLSPLLALAEDAKKEKKPELSLHIVALASAIARQAAEAARQGASNASVFAARGRFALDAISNLDGNNAPQLVVESMIARMRTAGP